MTRRMFTQWYRMEVFYRDKRESEREEGYDVQIWRSPQTVSQRSSIFLVKYGENIALLPRVGDIYKPELFSISTGVEGGFRCWHLVFFPKMGKAYLVNYFLSNKGEFRQPYYRPANIKDGTTWEQIKEAAEYRIRREEGMTENSFPGGILSGDLSI